MRNGLLKVLLSSQPIFGLHVLGIQTAVEGAAVIQCVVCSLSRDDA